MAWRPTQYLIAGELDNTIPGKASGWVQFAGMDEKVINETHLSQCLCIVQVDPDGTGHRQGLPIR